MGSNDSDSVLSLQYLWNNVIVLLKNEMTFIDGERVETRASLDEFVG